MTTTPRHPLVEDYLADLRRRADRLPRPQRDELLDELRSHVDDGAQQAHSEADIRNMLDSLGSPEEIVAASAPAASHTGPTGRLALGFGILALVLVAVPPLGLFSIPFGLGAVALGVRTRRFLSSVGEPTSIATAAMVTGGLGVAIGVLMFTFLVSADGNGTPEPAVPAPAPSGPEPTISGG